MHDRKKSLKDQASIFALDNAIRKASLLLGVCRTLRESSVLIWFIENASFQRSELESGSVTDVYIDKLIPLGMNKTMARNLKKKAGISTVQDLLAANLETFESGLRPGKVLLRELLRAMRPNVIGTGHSRSHPVKHNK